MPFYVLRGRLAAHRAVRGDAALGDGVARVWPRLGLGLLLRGERLSADLDLRVSRSVASGMVVAVDEADLAAGTDAAQDSAGAQSDAAVSAFERDGQALDPSRPSAMDPRETGLFGPRAPVSRHDRVIAYCLRDGRETVQDIYEVIVGAWFGASARQFTTRRSTAGKIGQRARFSGCAVCGCLYPADDRAREWVHAKGGDLLDPAKLPEERRLRAARAMRPRLLGGASIFAALLGVTAVFAAPLVWGPIGILLGIASYRGRQKFGKAAAVVAAVGAVIGTILHYRAPFGYG